MQPMRRSPAYLLLIAALASGCGQPTASGSPAVRSAPASVPGASVAASPTPTAEPSTSPIATPAPVQPAWATVAASGDAPPPREDGTWTVGDDGIAYLFGGRDGETVYGDLWAYDLATDAWAAIPATDAPPARFGHNAVWVDDLGLVIFAGQAGTAFYNDLWAYDVALAQWRPLPAAGALPTPRYGSCAVIGDDGRLWISHGFTSEGTRFSDTRTYDFGTDLWTDVTPAGTIPIARCLHACWLTDDGAFTLYAGQTTGVTALGDLWFIAAAGETWANAEAPLPPERNLPAVARWDGATIVVGGQGIDGGYLADAWRIGDDRSATALAPAGVAPVGRAGAELVADTERGRLLLFAGRDAAVRYNDVWALTLGPVAG